MTTIEFTATLTAPLHHGSGTSGNTSLLRTDDVVLPDGSTAQVPVVSGNSLRHTLREALAWHLVTTLDVAPGSLSKAVVDLLWSGGAITKPGAETNLDLARRVEELTPQLSMLGFSAGSDMVAGTLHVSRLHLVCAENAWRLPPRLAGHPHARLRAGALRGEDFGTRHDVSGTPVDRFVALAGATPSTQMIFDVQVLRPGAILAGRLHLTPAATATHTRLLGVALALAAPDGVLTLGAKSAVGYGSTRLDIEGEVAADVDWWTGHLSGHRAEILALLEEVVS